MATSKITLDEGSTTNTATNTITEDAVTKHIPRSVLNNSSGTEIGTSSTPVEVNLRSSTVGVATSAKQDTIIGHVDGIEGLLTTLAGAVSGTEIQADILSSALPTGASTSANQTTIIGHLDGVEGLLTTIDADTSNISTKIDTIAGAVSGTEVQADIVAALPAGTNAIGKLLAPDIDITGHTNYAKKYYTNAGAVTDGIIWSPAAGKRWHITTLVINVSAAATVTLEDDKSGGDEVVAKFEFAANSGITINYPEKYPFASGEDAADLIITTTAGNVYVQAVGYEI